MIKQNHDAMQAQKRKVSILETSNNDAQINHSASPTEVKYIKELSE